MRIRRLVFAAVILGASAATAASAEDPARIDAMEQNIAHAMQSESNTAVFWQPLGDGAVREKRSGMICTGELSAEMPLDFLSGPVPADAMSVVGCIYRSADRTRIVHIMLMPNLLGAAETRKMMRMGLDLTEKDIVSLGAAPIPQIADSEEEGLTSVAGGAPRLQYLASAPAGRWLVIIRAYQPKPDVIDLKETRKGPVALLAAALFNIENAKR